MTRVHRIDAGGLAKPIKRPDGTWIVEARISRSGVQTYYNADGSERREYRPPDEVFNKASMDSFKLVPVTNKHPPRMLTAENATQYSVGAVGENFRRDGNWLVAPVAVHDASTLREIIAGNTQVSNGYECDLVMGPGVSPDGERFDATQTQIRGNHLAVALGGSSGYNARAGQDAAIRMDAAYTVNQSCPTCDGTGKVNGTQCMDCSGTGYMSKRSDNMDLTQALAALAAANEKLGKHKERCDALETENKKLLDAQAADKKRLDTLEAERDAAKEAQKKAEQERTDAQSGQSALVDARVALLEKAGSIIGKMFKTDNGEKPITGLSERSLKLAVIKHVTNADCDVDPSTSKPRSMDYINARYDAATEQAVESRETFRGANNVIIENRNNASQRNDASKEYAAMVEENQNAWKRNLVDNNAARK